MEDRPLNISIKLDTSSCFRLIVVFQVASDSVGIPIMIVREVMIEADAAAAILECSGIRVEGNRRTAPTRLRSSDTVHFASKKVEMNTPHRQALSRPAFACRAVFFLFFEQVG